MSVIAGLLLALLLLLAVLVLVAVLVCLLLVATLALVVLLDRTGTDVSTASADLRERLHQPRRSSTGDAPATSRLPWSRRKPATAPDRAEPGTAASAPSSPAPTGSAATSAPTTAAPSSPSPIAGAVDRAPVVEEGGNAVRSAATAAAVPAASPAVTPAAAPRTRAVRASTSGTAARTRSATTAAGEPARDDAPTEKLPVASPGEERKAPATRTRPVRRPKPVVPAESTGDREAAMDRLFAPLTDSDRTEPLPRPQSGQEG